MYNPRKLILMRGGRMARKENNIIAELESTQEAVTNRDYKAEKCRDGRPS